MDYTTLGARGPRVSRFGLGTMTILGAGEAEAHTLVRHAIDEGLTLIDTADVYGDGRVEEVLGAALKGRRDTVVLATKFGLPMQGDTTRAGGSRGWMIRAVDDSLRRLRTDYIDLYQLHRPDPATPIDETVAAFDELITAGKVRFAGSSVFSAEQIVESQWAAERIGARPFATEQSPYSIFVRGGERATFSTCRAHGVGVIAWSPLNGGWLTGKYRVGQEVPADSRAASGNPFVRADDETKLALVDRLSAVAADAGLTLTQLGLAFTLAHPAISATLVGPRTDAQLTELLAAVDVQLSTATLDQVDAIVAPGVDVDPRNAGTTPRGLLVGERRRPELIGG
jgi:aryl-alcohol dehydrogenase-like predicted oxidoreductase